MSLYRTSTTDACIFCAISPPLAGGLNYADCRFPADQSLRGEDCEQAQTRCPLPGAATDAAAGKHQLVEFDSI